MSRGWWEYRAMALTDAELAVVAEVVEHEREIRAREETGGNGRFPACGPFESSSDDVRNA